MGMRGYVASFTRPGRRGLAVRAIIGMTALGLLSSCSGDGGTPGDPVGEWSGRLVTEQGTCPDRAPSRLLVEGRDISFIPAGGVLVLHGHRQPGAAPLHAQLSLVDMNHKPLPMVFEGRLSADGRSVEGTYGTPTCRAHATLLRPENHPIDRLLGG